MMAGHADPNPLVMVVVIIGPQEFERGLCLLNLVLPVFLGYLLDFVFPLLIPFFLVPDRGIGNEPRIVADGIQNPVDRLIIIKPLGAIPNLAPRFISWVTAKQANRPAKGAVAAPGRRQLITLGENLRPPV